MPRPVAALLLMASLLPAGCRQESAPSSRTARVSSDELPIVNTAFPIRKTITQKTEQPGRIEAYAVAPIHAKVSGYVKAVHVDIGDRVTGPKVDSEGRVTEPGQVLAVIDAPEWIEDVRQKRAKVMQAEADARQAEAAIRVAEAAEQSAIALIAEARSSEEKADADLERWKSEYARIAELAESKTVTQKLADETQQQLRSAEAAKSAAAARVQSEMSRATEARVAVEKSKADADSAKARLAVALAELSTAEVMVEYLTLRAPFDGVVSERSVDPGRLVQSAKGANDPPLFTVIQADTVRLFIEVPEADAVLVEPGRKALIRVTASGGTAIDGTVTRTSWSLSASNRTLRTEIDIPNLDGLLRPGMFAHVELTVAEREGTLAVPKAAVVTIEGQNCCLVFGPGGELQKRPVVVGLKTPTETEIVSGLTEADEILVANVAAFKPGQKVAKSAAK